MFEASNDPASEAPTMPVRPRLSFATVTFSDDTEISLDEDDIIVFVGPNNAGKSAALRELDHWISQRNYGVVVKHVAIRQTGTSADFLSYLKAYSVKSGDNQSLNYGGYGYSIHHTHVQFYDANTNWHTIGSFFSKRIATESRIQDSNAAPAIALFQTPPTHPIHLLLMDEKLASSISVKFRHAFGRDLTPFRAGGGNFPLYVGQKPELTAGQDELSRDFVEKLQNSNVLLEQQGDGMRSFASVALHVLATDSHSIQFLDEPEAFLHPPQARLLGKYIAESRRGNSQLFIATHSTDILAGLIEGGIEKVRIVRLRRHGNVNRVKELSKARTREISTDTLTQYSRVFDGIFHERVIICESDADCMFYQSIVNLPSIAGERRPDVLFVHTSGKHRMAKLADTLRSLDVPVSVIADIDVLNDKETFKNLFENLGGDWSDVELSWKSVVQTVQAQKPPLSAAQVAGMIRAEVEGVSGMGQFPTAKERAIKAIFKQLSAWAALKQSGRNALPGGEPTRQFDALCEICSRLGLWIVPVGELEGFCRSLGAHGPAFVERVLEDRDLEADPELSEARDFVRKVWNGV